MKGSPLSQLISVLILAATFFVMIMVSNMAGSKVHEQRAKMQQHRISYLERGE